MTEISEYAAALTDRACSADDYLTAVKAFLTALDTKALDEWEAAAKESFCRKLILQASCVDEMSVLAHEAASLISSGNRGLAQSLAKELWPTLGSILVAPPETAPGYENAVVLLLVLRTFLDGAMPESDIKRLHLDWFERFRRENLNLPYSTMFNDDCYGLNAQEILKAYPPGQPRVLENRAIKPWHILLFEWLSQQDYFRDLDNADLDTFLDRCLSDEEDKHRDFACTLVLRHFRTGGRLTPARLSELGLGKVAELANSLSNSRSTIQRSEASLPYGARSVQKRHWQLAQAAKSLATNKLPALNRGQRKLRIAVCVSGQLRGYRQALESWRRSIFSSVEPSFFVHSWSQVGRADAQPFRSVLPFEGALFAEAYRKEVGLIGYDEAVARYPNLFARLRFDAQANSASLAEDYCTDRVVLEDESAAEFKHFSKQQKMHYKIYAADQMAREAEEYDLFVRIRPDLEIRLLAFDWRDLHAAACARAVLYAEKASGLHYGHLMVGDQFAIAEPKIMSKYADTWKSYPAIAETQAGGWPKQLTGHVSLALTCWSNRIRMEKAPLRFGRLLDAAPMASPDIHAALNEDLASRTLDKTDKALLVAVRRDMATHYKR